MNAPSDDTLNAIRARRTAVDSEIAEHERALTELRSELTELEISERVVLRLWGETTIKEQHNVADFAMIFEAKVPSRRRPRVRLEETNELMSMTPPGLPTNAEMILDSLEFAHAKGIIGFEPAEIITYIQRRFWPDIPTPALSPTVWRMWKDHKIGKYGDLYGVMGQPEPDGEASDLKTAEARMMRLRALDEVKPINEENAN